MQDQFKMFNTIDQAVTFIESHLVGAGLPITALGGFMSDFIRLDTRIAETIGTQVRFEVDLIKMREMIERRKPLDARTKQKVEQAIKAEITRIEQIWDPAANNHSTDTRQYAKGVQFGVRAIREFIKEQA